MRNTAQVAVDFTRAALSQIVTFRGGQSKLLPVYYGVINDTIVEDEESFYVVLTDGLNARIVSPNFGLVYIEDDDGKTCI